MLAGILWLRSSVPPPLAPRVHVRWVDGISEAQRTALERQFSLVERRHREGSTWEYDLANPSTSTIQALVGEPAVDDTHYIDRANSRVTADAPIGTTLLPQRAAAGWIHSSLFDWFVSYCAASLLMSAVWLASSPRLEERRHD